MSQGSQDFYITFKKKHRHEIDSDGDGKKIFDHETIAVVNAKDMDEAYSKTVAVFGDKFEYLFRDQPHIGRYPRGIIKLS